ncbi:uncharacterized protein [Venturia canescens]|uniref:uncharacterized protein n=1 Tax=Venturia canescens TaxID=32260 RepID=UPI001C9BC099|nr:uncharacterized protein LOC122418458 [Venturia canescens]
MRNMTFAIIFALVGTLTFLGQSTVSKKNVGNENSVESNRRLSRKKRHLAFPTGTNFVTTITLLKAIQVNEPKNWNLDLEFDMIWPIPNGEKLLKKASKRTNIYHHIRRHKRDLYSKIELALSSQGLPGKECLLRTICEANIYLSSPGVSFLEDVLRVVLSHEDRAAELDSYDLAYRKSGDCHIEYPCPFSILEFLLNSNADFLV